MRVTYFNYAQAQAVKRDFGYLIGQPFKTQNAVCGEVSELLIVPHSKILQWGFMRQYGNGAQINANHPGKFGVAVVSSAFKTIRSPDLHCDIRDYLKRLNVAGYLNQYGRLN